MSLEIEVAEGKKPLEGSDENEPEDDTDSLEQDHNWINLNVVNFLSEVVLQLVSIDQEISAKQSGNSKTEEETLDIDDSLDHQENRGEYSEPFEEISVGEVTDEGTSSTFRPDGCCEGGVSVLRLGPEEAGPAGGVLALTEVQGRQGRLQAEHREVDGVEQGESEGGQVGDCGEPVVQSVPGGQTPAALQLVQHKVHPPPPLGILALLVTVLHLGPDVVEVVEELLGLVAAPIDGYGEEAGEEEAETDQEVVEAGVRSREDVVPAERALVGPVHGAARGAPGGGAAGRDAGQGAGEAIEEQHQEPDEAHRGGQAEVQLVVDICSLEAVDLPAQQGGNVEDVKEGHRAPIGSQRASYQTSSSLRFLLAFILKRNSNIFISDNFAFDHQNYCLEQLELLFW